jgi:hypothetical protein
MLPMTEEQKMSIEFNNVPGINDKNDMERMFSLL